MEVDKPTDKSWSGAASGKDVCHFCRERGVLPLQEPQSNWGKVGGGRARAAAAAARVARVAGGGNGQKPVVRLVRPLLPKKQKSHNTQKNNPGKLKLIKGKVAL